jgi:hypothetical protein
MKQARDPHSGDLIDVPEYVSRYGTKLSGRGSPRQRPPCRCPGCAYTMHTVGENAAGLRDGIFAHDRQNGTTELALFCPLKLSASWKYAGLTPTRPDQAAGQRLRANFMLNWRHHWALIKNYVLFPDIKAFIQAIRYLDTKQTWQHAGLTENLVPFILLTLHEFPPPIGKVANARKVTIRFWFDSTVRTTQDLWIRTTGQFRLIRAEYLPGTTRTGARVQLIALFDEEVRLNFLGTDIPHRLMPYPAQVLWMREAFQVV